MWLNWPETVFFSMLLGLSGLALNTTFETEQWLSIYFILF